ncbi:zinc-dependent metalloprotease [Leptothrix discophora]|uniref:Zinc-dependent metalloprotease n=1 Tax=Leptothrix discophora TaxID=89 RepID=A0ABT9G0Q5_LEPDI|nr:zinc-dependent metalloprotease [Leptothrix discophora]MDP4300042.1 zinc-dependent metalloprotease [Leptothrix discophora]
MPPRPNAAPVRLSLSLSLPLSLSLLTLLAACAQTGGTVEPGPAAAPAPAAAATASAAPAPSRAAPGAGPASAATATQATPAAPPAPGQPPAFATVIKDARRSEGLLPVWQREDKVWFELAESDFNQPFFLSPKIAGGIGEGRLSGGLMLGGGAWVEFRRVHNQVQLIERNADYIARAGTPEARAVAAAYSPSLVASTPLASAPHPERKTVLIDAAALLMGDWPGLASALQRSYRQNYGYDGRNSAITSVRVQPELIVFELQNHYAAPNLSFPQPGATPPGAPQPSFPSTLPDPRSLFLRLHYSLTRLPAEPMRPRPADPRIGHFTTVIQDYSDDLARNAKVRHVNRWRLEKKDPSAALSEPVKPITYWIDRNVPLKYRSVISDGILEWNTAFEKIGWRQAIEVRIQPDDASFDTLDTGVASVRWMLSAQPGLAGIGPSHVDPRSGEILDADIAFEGNSLRFQRLLRRQILAEGGQTDWSSVLQVGSAGSQPASSGLASSGPLAPAAALRAALTGADARCQAAEQGASQLGYALERLAADAGTPGVDEEATEAAAEALVRVYLKNLVMHEVGHTLGLRHNFRASHAVDSARLDDAEWTRDHPMSGSVMDYVPANLPRPGAPAPVAYQQQLGPYDFWAIEYAYRSLGPADERTELARIAARSAEPELAFGTDEDAGLGLDPETLQFDLGNDPVAHAARRIEIARDLIARAERQSLADGDEYARLRRRVAYALLDTGSAAGVALRQIGGVRTLRDRAGSGRDPLQPVPAARQRAALDLIARQVLSADGLVVSPTLQRKLAPDFFDRAENLGLGGPTPTEFIPDLVLGGLQRSVLAQLMSDTLGQRLLDHQGKASGPDDALTLAELLDRVRAEVWSELARPAAGRIEPLRRDLQRDHATRLSGALMRPSPGQRAELRSQLRAQARELHASLRRSVAARVWDAPSRRHLQDLLDDLGEALDAKVVRSVSGG